MAPGIQNWMKAKTQIEFRLGAEGDPESCRHTTEFTFTVMWERFKDFSTADLSLISTHFSSSAKGRYRKTIKIFLVKRCCLKHRKTC